MPTCAKARCRRRALRLLDIDTDTGRSTDLARCVTHAREEARRGRDRNPLVRLIVPVYADAPVNSREVNVRAILRDNRLPYAHIKATPDEERIRVFVSDLDRAQVVLAAQGWQVERHDGVGARLVVAHPALVVSA